MLTVLLMASMAEAKKPKAPPPPPVGWAREEGWTGDCYFPKDLSVMNEGDRRMERGTILTELKNQWSGSKDENIVIDSRIVEDLENVLLSKPTMIDGVAQGNLEQCKAFRRSGDLEPWIAYLRSLPPALTKGDCTKPFSGQLFNYLDVGVGWQQPIHMCKGNKVRVSATQDKFRVVENGPWITVEGDPAVIASDPQYPCNAHERCFAGTLLVKFVTEAGVEVIMPAGAEMTYTAPENGTMYFGINDYQWYDNRYFKSATIEDRVALTVESSN
ncbi:MAG TPA: hypothetical protein PLA94_28375 [Myxococcota bacterium]|nr:hypothetical protein [Myxococcota bacterium]